MANVKNNKKCNLSNLLSGTLESFYWLGFILADGSFIKDTTVKLSLSSKDLTHVEKFAEFINVKPHIYQHKHSYGSGEYASASAYDKVNVKIIKSMLKCGDRKTYNPPSFRCYNFNTNEMLSLIIGFIDGDGCVRHKGDSYQIKIESHHAWMDNLSFIQEFLHKETRNLLTASVSINSRGYCCMTIGKSEIIKNLKYFIDENKLPVLERKWSAISSTKFRTLNIVASKYASKSVPITINNISFGSISEASRYFDCKPLTIKNYISRKI